MTGDPLDLGLVGLAQITPFLLLFMVTGMLADRVPRVRILFACVLLQVISAGAFLYITVTGTATFPMMFGILLVLGTARAFQSPAQQALTPLLVPPEHLSNAIAWSTSGFNTSKILGPGIAGLLIILSISVVYAVVVTLLLFSTTMLLMMRVNTQILSKDPVTARNVLAGLRFIFSRQVVLAAVSLDLFAVLLGGVKALLPVFATEILNVDSTGFGILKSAETVGSLACFLVLTHRPIRRGAGNKLLTTIILYGAGIIVFGLSTNFWLSFAALMFMGGTDAISMFIRQNLVQIITPDDIRGRVNAVNSVVTGASGQVGEFESGITAHWWGAVPAVLVGGIATICVTLIFMKLIPEIRRINSLDPDDLIQKYQNPDRVDQAIGIEKPPAAP